MTFARDAIEQYVAVTPAAHVIFHITVDPELTISRMANRARKVPEPLRSMADKDRLEYLQKLEDLQQHIVNMATQEGIKAWRIDNNGIQREVTTAVRNAYQDFRASERHLQVRSP